MRVFKFGGASVKDAEAVKNVAAIVQLFTADKLIIVVSAMGKTTNALERLTDAFFYKKEDSSLILTAIKDYHFNILKQLFKNSNHPVFDDLHNTFVELEWAIEDEPTHTYDHEYDQIVSMGEILASKIVSAYLNEVSITNKWWDVRDFIKTDNTYREGKVDWTLTEQLVQQQLLPYFKDEHPKIIITQGFIAGTSENFTATLGREGSDYTAAILAYTTNSTDVTIWKDVPGVLNADPKWFDKTILIDQLSYYDAIELAYYGATVIHPKTLKPLQNKHIPLYVRSFIKPTDKGTRISVDKAPLPTPCFIFKVNQFLLTLSPKDFSFIVEENLSDIFKLFSKQGVKINTMQSSALSFSVCMDNNEPKVALLLEAFKEHYHVLYNDNIELVTIRYYDQETIDRVCVNKKVYLEVKSRHTVQIAVKNL